MTQAIDIDPSARDILIALVDQYIPNTDIWAFGSRTQGKARPTSDLDLVAFSRPEQASAVAAFREALEESDIPFRVDVHVWDELPESFQRTIKASAAPFIIAKEAGVMDDDA